MSMYIRDVMCQTDWALLREQKKTLIKCLEVRNMLMDEDEVAFEGLLNWMDAVQDAVVDEGIANSDEVFGRSEGDDE